MRDDNLKELSPLATHNSHDRTTVINRAYRHWIEIKGGAEQNVSTLGNNCDKCKMMMPD
jgi:hypothetical protein